MKFKIQTSVALLLLASGAAHAQTLAQHPCAERLIVELTPDVPHPRNPGFLSSLLSNHPAYSLTLVREDDSTTIVVDLIGPGPDYRCQDVIRTMRRDGRVISVRPETDELPQVEVNTNVDVDANPPPPDTHVTKTGVGSLFWSAIHPGQAWRILMPVKPGDPAGAFEDYRVACLEKQASTDEFTQCP